MHTRRRGRWLLKQPRLGARMCQGTFFFDGKVNLRFRKAAERNFIYASNEPKSVLARDLGDCRDNLRNSRSVFLIVFSIARPENNAKKAVLQSANCKEQI